MKTIGATSVGTIFLAGTAAGDGDLVDGIRDTTDLIQEAIVVFESNTIIDSVLGGLVEYYAYDVLPLAYVKAGNELLNEILALDGVIGVQSNRELEYLNADVREVTGTNDVQAGDDVGAYDGSSVHVAVIDSGIDDNHPDFSNIENTYQWVGNPLGEPTLWLPAESLDTDAIGHGTHVSGTIGGDGTASEGTQRGHAPGVALTSYSAGLGITVLKATAAYDHLLSTHPGVQVVSNSYGASGGEQFDPNAPMNVATKNAYDSGTLSLFAAGNAGPERETLNPYAKAPYVLGVGATNDQREVTEFSSRGNPDGNFDRQRALSTLEADNTDPIALERVGVGAPGNNVISTVGPTDALNQTDPDLEPYYAAVSGTSMSCPCVAGIAALIIDAYQQNGHGTPAAIDVVNTIEATATSDRSDYTPINIGAGFVDAVAAISRAEDGNLADFDDVAVT